MTFDWKNFQGAMGMFEMEVAAAIIATKASQDDVPVVGMKVSIEDFLGDKQAAVGFVELLSSGWLEKTGCYYNGQFSVTQPLANRINAKMKGKSCEHCKSSC